METNPINFISNYMNNKFFQAVEYFEQVIEICLKKAYSNDEQSKMNDKSQMFDEISHFFSDFAGSHSFQLIVLRAIHIDNITFLLAVQSLAAKNYFCVIISSFDEPLNGKWKFQSGLNMRILIKQSSMKNQAKKIKICTAKIENIIVQPITVWRDTFQNIKQKGNQNFKAKNFINALLYYEYGLTYQQFKQDRNSRSILYANAAACFAEMRMYDNVLRYANLSIKIDTRYAKGYFRKINALLQKKSFEQIPNVLLKYAERTQSENFNKLNAKYTNYIANNLGIFNWSQILWMQNSQLNYCDYISHKIQLRDDTDGRKYFYAKENIAPYQMVLYKKPLYYAKNKADLTEWEICRELQTYMLLQQSFQEVIKKLPQFRKTASHASQERYLKNYHMISQMMKPNKYSQYMIGAQQIQKYKFNTPQGYGIWPDFFSFQHDCQPNCSYVHIKTGLCVSSVKNISKGTKLSLDYASYEEALQRKKHLKQKYKIQCNCRACQWVEWPKNSLSLFDMMEAMKDLDNILMIKQLFWGVIRDKDYFQQHYGKDLLYKDVMQKYIKLVTIQSHWIDILKLLQFLRLDEVPATRFILWEIVSDRFVKFFKIDASECPSLVNYVL